MASSTSRQQMRTFIPLAFGLWYVFVSAKESSHLNWKRMFDITLPREGDTSQGSDEDVSRPCQLLVEAKSVKVV